MKPKKTAPKKKTAAKKKTAKKKTPAAKKLRLPDVVPPDPPEEQERQKDPVDVVADFLIEGHAAGDILEYLEVNCTKEAAANIIEQALVKFVKIAKMPKEVRRGWCIEALRHLYGKMEHTGDYAGALRAIVEIAKLADVIPSKNNKPIGTEETKDEIDLYIEEMMAL